MAEQTHAEKTLRNLVSRLGFGDGITEPMADNDTIVAWFEEQGREAAEWREHERFRVDCSLAGHPQDGDCTEHGPACCNRPHVESGRQSGDRVLPAPYDTLSATDREVWLACETVYDAALTEDARRANTGRTMTAWQDLIPEAQQALITLLVYTIQNVHRIALDPAARREESSDG